MELDFVFVVLVYRNTKDLLDFFENLKVANCKVIVVNSFYNDETMYEFERISKDNDADFINIPNKGYGYGNNVGCKYALDHYNFRFLIVSNADVIIKKLAIDIISDDCITAPKIVNKAGKRQNPHLPFDYGWMIKLKYYLFKKNSKKRFLLLMIFSRLMRELFLLFRKKGTVFSAHGAFVIIPNGILSSIYPLYNEEQFLFCEEDHLAMLCKTNGIKTVYDSRHEIFHKEDGSVSFLGSTYELTKQSYITFYENWFK